MPNPDIVPEHEETEEEREFHERLKSLFIERPASPFEAQRDKVAV